MSEPLTATVSPSAPAPVAQPATTSPHRRSRSGAIAVAAGILLSRLAGFARTRALAHYLGTSDAAGAFQAALRIPNFLQNMLGEGVLSASFIPVYARLLSEGKEEEAGLVARTVAALLLLVASACTALGIAFAPAVTEFVAPGFTGELHTLTVNLVRILFPGTAVLVLSAWCLGVLNSHRRFFLSYASPVVWNAAIIAAVILAGRHVLGSGSETSVVTWAAIGVTIGSGLQLLVQLPRVFSLLHSFKPQLELHAPSVRAVLRAFGPVLLGRGSVQLSALIDQNLSSYLNAAMVSAMGYAQTLYLVPVSLFGMSISASELTEMSRERGSHEEVAAQLQKRLAASLRQVVFFVVPSAVAFVAIGPTLVDIVCRGGRFGAHETWQVWIVLCGSAMGLTAGTQGRLLSSAFYALRDTRTPFYCGLVRLALTAVSGWLSVLPLRAHFGYGPVWGALGLTGSAGVAAWLEFMLLKRQLAKRIGAVPVPGKLLLQAFAAAGAAGALGFGMQHLLGGMRWWLRAAAVVPVFGAVYLVLTLVLAVPEARNLLQRIRKKVGR